MKRYAVMSDFRHKEESQPQVEAVDDGIPAPVSDPGPSFIALLETDDFEEAEARYQEAFVDDINDKIQLIDTSDYSVLKQNF